MAGALVVSKAACAAIDIAVEVAKLGVRQVYDRIVALGLNEKLQRELCRKVKQLEGILMNVEITAHDTNDKPILQAIKEVNQYLKKCLTTCDRIEKKNAFSKFCSALKESNELKALDSLLEHSLQALTTQLTASIHNTNAERQRDLRHLEAVVRNPDAGFYRTDREDLAVPEKVEKLLVKELSPGQLEVCWTGVASASQCMYYELEYDQPNKRYKKEEQNHTSNYNTCLLDNTEIKFPNKFSYSIRIRAVNGRGRGRWSECAVGKFTVLPSPPRKPLAIHVNSSTSVSLVMEKPPVEDRVKPVTHFVVEYHRVKETGHGHCTEFAINNFGVKYLKALTFQRKDAYKINLEWNLDTTPMPMYHVKISLRNADGVGDVYQDDIRTDTISPNEPVKPEDSDPVVYTNTDTIIIKWSKPETNAYLLDHYEIHWGRDGKVTKLRKTKHCYAVFRELESWKKYFFKVRAVSRTGIKSDFLEINAETDSKAGKVAKVAGIGAGAALFVPASAILSPVSFGALAGMSAAESVEDKGKGAEVAAGTAAGIGGAIGGLALGVIATPLSLVAAPFVGIGAAIVAPIKMHCTYKDYLNEYRDESIDEDLEKEE